MILLQGYGCTLGPLIIVTVMLYQGWTDPGYQGAIVSDAASPICNITNSTIVNNYTNFNYLN